MLEKYDEKPLNRFLARNVSGFSSSLENNLAQMQFSYLKDKADSGKSFVVVGRCAETVLKEYDGLITIFVLGDEETRVKRIEQLHGLSEDEAKRLVKTKDWRRKSYHNCYSRGRWGDSRNYDLSINSSRLGIEGTTKMLEEMRRRGWTRCRNKNNRDIEGKEKGERVHRRRTSPFPFFCRGVILLPSRVGTFGTESAVRKWKQQEFAVFKCGSFINFRYWARM